MRMSKVFFFLLLSFVFYTNVNFAQNGKEEYRTFLMNALRNSKPDTGRIRVYAQIATYYETINQDSAAYFLSQGIAFAVSVNDKKGEAKLLEAMGQLDISRGMSNKGRQDYLAALEINKALNDTAAMGSDYGRLGFVSVSKGDYTEATSYYLKALKIFESLNDKKRIAGIYISLGMLTSEMEHSNKALTYLFKARDILSTLPFSMYNLQLMNDIGLVYNDLKKYDSALYILNEGITKSTDPEYALVRTQLMTNAATSLYRKGDRVGAAKYLTESLELAEKMNFKTTVCYDLVNLSEVRNDDPERSLAELKRALAISQELGQKKLEMGIYENMADFYKRQKRFEDALYATEKRDLIKDSLLSKQQSVEVADLESTYELERSNDKINTLTLINARDQFKTKLVIAIAAGIALLLVVVGFSYRRTAILNKQLIAKQQDLQKLNILTNKQKEELRELNAVKDKMFSVIGHDLRSPLGNIIGMLQVMEDERVINEEYRPFISELRQNTLGSLDTLDKLLYWGKNSFKGIFIQQQVFAVNAVVQSNISLLASAAQQKHITVTDAIPAGVQIFADVSHFDFVTRNLLSNALKFTPDGGKINIGLAGIEKPGFVLFAVQDTGVGMSQEEQDHLFSLDNTSKIGTQEEVGTGIGLLLCKEFVEKNGGELWVTSKQGEGSTFFFSFKTA